MSIDIKMDIICCDDESCGLNQVNEYIALWAKSNEYDVKIFNFDDCDRVVCSYKNGFRARLIFMNICFENEKLDGYLAAKQIKAIDNDANIVFISKKYKYVVEGYGIAIKYLLKPLYYEDIEKFLDSFFVEAERRNKKFIAKSDCGYVSIPISEIFYVESVGHSLDIHLQDSIIKSNGSLKSAMESLSTFGIAKCHRAFLINTEKIRSLKESEIVLLNNTTIPLSRRERQNIIRKFKFYHETNNTRLYGSVIGSSGPHN